MISLQKHIVPPKSGRIRLREYACLVFQKALISRKGVKKAIKRGAILVNGQPSNTGYWVKSDDIIELVDLEQQPPKPFTLALPIVFEDEDFALINKPAGIIVSGNQYRTVENALSFNLRLSPKTDALRWPRPVHRLDGPTCGLLLVAKTANALIDLGQQFEQKQIKKGYQAIVMGNIAPKGIIDTPIDGKAAITIFEAIRTVPSLRSQTLSLVNLYPQTGRTHQLRKHLAAIGHPILGDALYGEKGKVLLHKGLFLCAITLQFKHPTKKESSEYSIKAPAKFITRLDREKRRWEAVTKS